MFCWAAKQDITDQVMNEKRKFIFAHTEDWESKSKMFSDLIFDSKRKALSCSLLGKQEVRQKALYRELH